MEKGCLIQEEPMGSVGNFREVLCRIEEAEWMAPRRSGGEKGGWGAQEIP